jgi:hypothetical protein
MKSNPKIPLSHRSEAMRLITWRGEGLVKMLDPTFDLNMPATQETFDKFNFKWNFLFRQIADPNKNRPERRVIPIPEATFGWDPLLGREADPVNLMGADKTDFQHTCVTNTSLLPRDGKMELFGANSGTAIGICCDIRHCDLNNERFVFEEDACTDNDWWMNRDATMYQQRFKSQTINDLREKTNHVKKSETIREYNDILAGINEKSLSTILLQPAVGKPSPEPGSQQYYHDRFNAIYRKLYVAAIFNRHLPIIIADANEGVSEYSVEQQQEDLEKFWREHPDNQLVKLLVTQNKALIETIDLENEEKMSPPSSPILDPDVLTKIQLALLDKIALLGDNYRLYNKLGQVNRLILEETDDNTLIGYQLLIASLLEALEQNKISLGKHDTILKDLDPGNKQFRHLQQLIKTQLDRLDTISELIRTEHKFLPPITYEELAKSLPTTENVFLKKEGIVYSKDNNNKGDGLEQLYGDFERGMSVFSGRHSNNTDPAEKYVLNSFARFEAFIQNRATPEQVESLKKHYSQGPFLMAVAPLYSAPFGKGMVMGQPDKSDRKLLMYTVDNEIYIDCIIKRYPLRRTADMELLGYVNGPVKVTFKLTEPDGFKFEKLQTTSKFIKDVYLGKKLTKKDITKNLVLDISAPEIVARYEKCSEVYLKHLQGTHNPDLLTKRKIAIVKELITILNEPDIDPSQKIKSFHNKLADKSETLTKRREPAFMTFVKGLGAVAIAILTLGVYGTEAWERLLGKRATHAGRFIDDVINTSKTKKPRL